MSEKRRVAASAPAKGSETPEADGGNLSVQALQHALRTGAIVPFFQPIVSVQSGALRGFEVLARCRLSGTRIALPDRFIPVARDAGLLPELTLHMVATACRAAHAWPGSFYLAFNMPPTLFQDAALVEQLIATLEDTGFPLRRIRIEMTEVEVVEDERAAELGIAQLRRLGIGTLLDDFGTGYSSLIRLHRFEFDKIKIDGSFIRSLERDEASRKIVSAIVGLGRSLGARTVAECVETAFQLQFLASIGCDAYQGWYLAAAMDADGAAQWLAARGPAAESRTGSLLTPYQQQYQLEILYERSPVGLAFIDTQLCFAAVNHRFCQMLGLPQGRVIGRSVHDVVPPQVAHEAHSLILHGLSDAGGDLRELSLPGRPETFLMNHERVLDAAGVVLGVSVVCIDITESKRYQAALDAREAHDLGASAMSPTLFWVAEESGMLSYISPHAREDELIPLAARIDRWYARMDPQDRVRVRREWDQRAPDATEFHTRFRIRWADGQWRWVDSRARLQADGQGRRWYGSFTDISREVALEQQLAGQS